MGQSNKLFWMKDFGGVAIPITFLKDLNLRSIIQTGCGFSPIKIWNSKACVFPWLVVL